MIDIHSEHIRSKNMASIKAKNTKPEHFIRRSLHGLGFRYKLHDNSLPGKPDMVFPKYKAIIEINGCFWHGHNCHLFKWPKTNVEFWRNKILQNMKRDRINHKILSEQGWRILTVWECSIKGKYKINESINIEMISTWLKTNKPSMHIKSAGK